MERELVLGVDAGHTVTKAVLFDAAGRAVAAVGLAGHGDGLYAVDAKGRPVRRARSPSRAHRPPC